MNVIAHYNEFTNVVTFFCDKCGIPSRIRALGDGVSIEFIPQRFADINLNINCDVRENEQSDEA